MAFPLALIPLIAKEGSKKSAATTQGAIGVAQLIQGGRLRKKGEAAAATEEDPVEQAMAAQLRRRTRAFQTGTATASTRSAVLQSQRQGLTNALRFGGRATGLNQLQANVNQGLLGLRQAELSGELQFQQLFGQTQGNIIQRRLEVQQLKSSRLFARGAVATQAGMANTQSAIAQNVGKKSGGSSGGAFGNIFSKSSSGAPSTTSGGGIGGGNAESAAGAAKIVGAFGGGGG